MQKFNILDWVAIGLVIIGGLNWGLVGVFNYNLVDNIFGIETMITKIIYGLVGLAAVYMIYVATKMNKA